MKILKEVLDEYWEKESSREQPATKTTLRLMVRKAAGPAWVRMRGITDDWLSTQPPQGRALEDHLNQYVREQGLYTIGAGILDLFDRSPKDLNPHEIRKRVDDLCISWESDSSESVAFSQHQGVLNSKDSNHRVPTGIRSLDSHIRGGLGAGELGIVVAPPKHGKTTFLLNWAANAALRGRRVLHTTLEIHEADVVERLSMCLGGYTGEEVRTSPQRQAKSKAKVKKSGGEILIRDVSHETFTAPRLMALIERSLPLDLVTIDYMALMRGSRGSGDRYEELGDLARDLRQLSARYRVPIWTAHQTTRAAIGMRSYDMSYVSESILPVQICDVLVLLFQTPKEKEQGVVRAKLECTRGSQENPIVDLKIDYGKMQVREAQ